jgi:TrmH RNA methyltransferase
MKSTKKNQETRVYGRHASLKIFEKRPHDIVRAYITREGVFEFRALLKFLADHKISYHVVEKDELDSITKATHHENISIIVKNKKIPSFSELLEGPGRKMFLCLEAVDNPHNMGAIMRSAAHFGVTGILYEAKVPVANSAAAIRTAEGGAETVPTLQVSDWSFVLDVGRKLGIKTFSTSSHEGVSLFETEFPDKMMLFLGAEGEGLSGKLMKKIDEKLSIPGTGEVESLNVSNATTAFLTEWYRQGR